MSRIELNNNSGKSWEKFQHSYIKGFAFLGNKLLTEEDILTELLNSIKLNRLNEKLFELNGDFSAVISYQSNIYLIADKYKKYPLLYSKINGEWIITDQSRCIMDLIPNYEADEEALTTYLALGYLHGDQTFLKDCKIVSAGTWVLLDDKAVIFEYHNHIYTKVSLTDDEIMKGCINTLENAMKRVVLSIGDRPIWIPLSGGYDSRLLACVCKKLNIKNVSCFTYGYSDSYEVKISKKVAEVLGFPWFNVKYTKEKFVTIVNSPIDEDYMYWAMNLNTTAHSQDFLAFKELRSKGIIQDNAVILPGHSGEILGRDQVPYELLNSKKTIAELLFYKYFNWNIIKRKFKRQILNNLGVSLNQIIARNDKGLAIDLFTNWNIKNRQSNYIINSVRVYEYFGVEWRIPLWDDELSKFWLSLPWEKNSNVKLYNQFMFENYFIPMNVPIYKEKNITTQLLTRIKLPFNLKSKIKRKLSKLKYFEKKYDVNGANKKTIFYLKKLNIYSTKSVLIKSTKHNAVLAFYQIFLVKKYFENKTNK